MPSIHVHNAQHTDAATAAVLIAELTAAYAAAMGIRPDTVRVVITTVPRTHWGVGGVTLDAAGQDERVEAPPR